MINRLALRITPLRILAAIVMGGIAPASWGGTFYLGLDAGRSRLQFDSRDFESGMNRQAIHHSLARTATNSWGVLGGLAISPSIALEAGYVSHGSFEFRSRDVNTIDSVFDTRARSLFAAVKATAGSPGGFSVFGKLGVAVNAVRTRYSVDESKAVFVPVHSQFDEFHPYLASRIFQGSYTEVSTSTLLGAGLSYALSSELQLSLGYDSFGRAGDANTTGRVRLTRTYAGINYSF